MVSEIATERWIGSSPPSYRRAQSAASGRRSARATRRRGASLRRLGEDLARDLDGAVRRRPPGVEREVRDELRELVLRHAVLERKLQVVRQLVRAVSGDERRDRNEAP